MCASKSDTGVRVAVLVALLSLAPAVARAQPPSLDVVLGRAAEHVDRFRNQLSGIVSEERYEQEARSPYSNRQGFPGSNTEHIVLRSDFLLVRPPGATRPVEFRDVFEVDGRLIRDREERLTRLFLNPTASALGQIERITLESARHNIGLIQRTLNTPTFALLFLDPAYRIRFRFDRVDDFEPSLEFGQALPEESTDLWVLEYQEVRPDTLIHGRNNGDLPARGRFWIEPSSGRLWASELILEDEEVDAIVDVRFAFDPNIGHFVPTEMRERYGDVFGSRVEGTATYSNFRRFQVVVEEGLQPEEDAPHDRN